MSCYAHNISVYILQSVNNDQVYSVEISLVPFYRKNQNDVNKQFYRLSFSKRFKLHQLVGPRASSDGFKMLFFVTCLGLVCNFNPVKSSFSLHNAAMIRVHEFMSLLMRFKNKT